MEVTQVGVTTRARAMAVAAEETEDNSGAVKRRKVGDKKLRSPSLTSEQTKARCEINYVKSAQEEDPSNSLINASANLKSGGVPASCCSSTSTGSMEKVKIADLEKSFGAEASARHKLNGSESTPKAESGEMESCTAKRSPEMVSSCRTVLSPEKMPPEAELEAFFVAAEEDLNKRFKDKYNYDIVNDIPLEGRYDWVQLTPGK